ncbi:21 kDa protein [Vitis vinifera]|uniref:21 kDa protein n=1 Tax=Vitis vinifera TaxID=29760 RepID=A0A438DXK9_VITVI|nr:21 kDa protein [Vitis vinifera]
MEGSFFSSHFLPALLIFLSLTSYINLSSAARPAADKASTEFIRTSCGTTTYPRLCYTSLSAHASVIQTSPKLLADTALAVTLSTARSTSSLMSKMVQSHGLKPREVAAMHDCVEELSDSVDQLRRAMGEMTQIKGSNFGLMMDDIQTWVSTALTAEDTCTDGFAGNAMNGNLKTTVRARIVNMAHMTSNALGLINSYASLHN